MTNFDVAADRLTERTRELREDVAKFDEALAVARVKTAHLLDIAKRRGGTAVSIGKIHSRVGNESWGFSGSGSIFTPKDEREDGTPLAWRICDEARISYGAGNTGQHQADTSELIDGVYELRGGNWYRIDLED